MEYFRANIMMFKLGREGVFCNEGERNIALPGGTLPDRRLSLRCPQGPGVNGSKSSGGGELKEWSIKSLRLGMVEMDLHIFMSNPL